MLSHVFSINSSMTFLEAARAVRKLADGSHPDGGIEGVVTDPPAQDGCLSRKSVCPLIHSELFTLHWTM